MNTEKFEELSIIENILDHLDSNLSISERINYISHLNSLQNTDLFYKIIKKWNINLAQKQKEIKSLMSLIQSQESNYKQTQEANYKDNSKPFFFKCMLNSIDQLTSELNEMQSSYKKSKARRNESIDFINRLLGSILTFEDNRQMKKI